MRPELSNLLVASALVAAVEICLTPPDPVYASSIVPSPDRTIQFIYVPPMRIGRLDLSQMPGLTPQQTKQPIPLKDAGPRSGNPIDMSDPSNIRGCVGTAAFLIIFGVLTYLADRDQNKKPGPPNYPHFK